MAANPPPNPNPLALIAANPPPNPNPNPDGDDSSGVENDLAVHPNPDYKKSYIPTQSFYLNTVNMFAEVAEYGMAAVRSLVMRNAFSEQDAIPYNTIISDVRDNYPLAGSGIVEYAVIALPGYTFSDQDGVLRTVGGFSNQDVRVLFINPPAPPVNLPPVPVLL